MALNKKHITGIAIVTLAAVYSLTRWRGNSAGAEEQASAADNTLSPTTDQS